MAGLKAWVVVIALALAGGSAAHADAPAESASASEWVQVTPPPVRLDGRMYEATCSHAAGTDPAYRFWMRRGTAPGIVVFFDGGGACWDDITCAIPRRREAERDDDGFYKPELIPSDNPNRFGGIFDLSNPRNPVGDWTFIYVPYCTGDVHSGSNTATYADPDTGEPYTIEHRGADNFRAVLDWMKDNLEQPQHLLVAGSSAGAYGASTHYARIRAAFPRGRALMIGDAGQGVMTQNFLDQRNTRWRMVLPREVLPRNVAITPETDIVARLAARYPNDRFAQYTTAHDITQSSFYALMGAENACIAWTNAMVTGLERRQHSGNFRSYLASGETHSILRTPRFYTEQSGGAPLAEWLRAALRPDADGWENRECRDCMVRPTRCSY